VASSSAVASCIAAMVDVVKLSSDSDSDFEENVEAFDRSESDDDMDYVDEVPRKAAKRSTIEATAKPGIDPTVPFMCAGPVRQPWF